MSKDKAKSSGALPSPSSSPPLDGPSNPQTSWRTTNGELYGGPASPITALPQALPPPPTSPKQHEKPKSLFSSTKFSKSQTRLPTEGGPSQAREPVPPLASIYQHGKGPGSTPDLAGEGSSASDPSSPRFDPSSQQQLMFKNSVKSHSEPHLLNDVGQPSADAKGPKRDRPNKHKFGQILSRSKSVQREENPVSRQPISEDQVTRNLLPADCNPLRAAPLEPKTQDKTFRDIMRASRHNRSADRTFTDKTFAGPSSDNLRTPSKERRNPTADSNSQAGHFFQTMRNSKSKASDLGKAGKDFFGKLTRSGSSHDRENGDHVLNPDNFTPNIIRMGIVEQTRLTRISKRLDQSRDKTEFWLPALPWRCIDYLNLKGTEVEGLYRVSGSVRELKKWQMRFDHELDVDLLSQENLYDVNVVASMLKDWLRNIPDEIFPKHIQAEIQRQCPDAANLESCPPIMQNELSKLPPFNYYLLFAITCHLSLLTSCYDKTKMDFENLCVCIQPSLNLDRFIFKILIKDWRNCWSGCWTEKEYLSRENAYIAGNEPNPPDGRAPDSRTLSSSGSGHPSSTMDSASPEERSDRAREAMRATQPRDGATMTPRSSSRTRGAADASDDVARPARERDGLDLASVRTELPELTPLQPLSPLDLS